MKNVTYDVGVIGSGPAGLAAAFRAKGQGKSVVIIEKYLWGGTCPNYGCDPKKILMSAVEGVTRAQQMSKAGLKGTLAIDWPALMAHKQTYVDAVKPRKTKGLDDADIERVYGAAQFISTDEVLVAQADTTIKATDWIIAVGQRPSTLPIRGAELLGDNETFLNLAEMPATIAFIGAGFVGIEFATIASAAGAQVHVIDRSSEALSGFDPEHVDDVVQHLANDGVEFHFGVGVVAVTRNSQGLQVELADETSLQVDAVFNAAGRTGNADLLAVDNANIKIDEHGEVLVDNYLRSSNPHVYSIGDVASSPVPKIVPVGNFEGRYVADLLTGATTAPISYPATPVVVFAKHRLAQVGMTMAAARANNYKIIDFDVTDVITFYRSLDAAKVRVVVDNNDVIVGASVVADEAEELINYFVTIINTHRTFAQTQANIYAYPSLGSDMADYYA
ncbi:NAD(P)/FAD-dependent oxidoreductase [Periweissella cryptocerci]|uniref:NAD(P)/FAD-dependent oxidoreductase n=1 Tax=Periweissella cryptocerci TaxID=2506420 RepID=A0A4P6YU79_9LACO|nr:NAD(P)/FAD-dependent oxidoreductase [Periweissella cryptocerci]QBO36282.1 NAD(P)/FAD-dependent oxidoreductase [Periweissella cryptocerci]